MLALPDGKGLDDWIAKQQFPDRDSLFHAMLEHVTDKVAIAPKLSTDPLFDVDDGPWAPTNLADARRLLEYAPERLCVVRTAGHWRLLVEGAGGRWRAEDGALSDLLAECALAWQRRITKAVMDSKLTDEVAKRATNHAVKAALPRTRADMLGGLAAAYLMMERRALLPAGLTVADERDIDADLLSLGAPNGVIDLRTGQLLSAVDAHKRLVTRSVADPFNPTATHPSADSLFEHLDDELSDYLASAFGFALRGNPARRIYGLAGDKNGGKSTVLSAIHAALGDVKAGGYGMGVDVDALLRSKFSPGRNAHHGNLFGLQDARIAVTEEPGKGTRFDGALLKRLAGGDYFSLRDVGEKAGPGRPISATLFVALNPGQETALDTSDDALADRVRLLSYPKLGGALDPGRISAVKTDHAIRQAVMACLARWAAETASRPEDPPSVKEYTAQRRRESVGLVGQWIQDRLVVTGERWDKVYLTCLWESISEELGKDDKGRVEGVDYKQMLALARELLPDLPRSVRGGKQGSVWRGVKLLDAEEPCSICDTTTPQGQLLDTDGRGKTCSDCPRWGFRRQPGFH